MSILPAILVKLRKFVETCWRSINFRTRIFYPFTDNATGHRHRRFSDRKSIWYRRRQECPLRIYPPFSVDIEWWGSYVYFCWIGVSLTESRSPTNIDGVKNIHFECTYHFRLTLNDEGTMPVEFLFICISGILYVLVHLNLWAGLNLQKLLQSRVASCNACFVHDQWILVSCITQDLTDPYTIPVNRL